MCLLLYVASPRPFVGTPPSPLQIAVADAASATALRGAFANRHIALVTVGGCSCAFPYVIAEAPIESVDGPLGDGAERTSSIATVSALLHLLERLATPTQPVEVFAVWNGEESRGAKGRIDKSLAAIDPEHFFFCESFLYVLRA